MRIVEFALASAERNQFLILDIGLLDRAQYSELIP
jgi:hypothetical protein